MWTGLKSAVVRRLLVALWTIMRLARASTSGQGVPLSVQALAIEHWTARCRDGRVGTEELRLLTDDRQITARRMPQDRLHETTSNIVVCGQTGLSHRPAVEWS